MATGGEEKNGYSLANVGTLTLKATDKYPTYISIVVCQDKIVVLDRNTSKVQIHGLKDGKVLATSDRLESRPRDMCLMNAMTICVLQHGGLIKIMSIDSTNMSRVIKSTRTLRLQVVLDVYHGVVRFKDSLVVTGVRQGMMYWCIVSLLDGHVDTIHQICKGGGWCRVTTKDTMIYISCYPGYKSRDTGVYGFDILNPSQCKYKYKHQRLQWPTSIVINDDGNIFVCNDGYLDFCIHQLTASCQLVAIFRQGIPSYLQAIFWDNGCLYGTCWMSPGITVFSHLYQGSHKASEVLVSDERRHPVTEETAIQIGHGNLQQKIEQRDLSASEEYHEEEGQDDEPITQEHINHARLCNALTTVCADALREILVNQVPVPYANIYQVILAKEANLPRKLSDDQCDVVFPDTPGTTGTVDQFDISLLYSLIRNVSSVPVPSTGWGNPPLDQPRDTSLGASVERIRFSRNAVSGHSVDGKIGEAVFKDYWQKIDHVLCDIESVIGVRGYRVQLEKRKNQVITPHEAHRLQSQFQEYQKQVEGDVENVKQQVSDFKEEAGIARLDVGIIKHDVDDVKQAVGELNEEVVDVKQKVVNVKQEVVDMKQELVNVKQEVKHVVGDVMQKAGNVMQQVGGLKEEVGDVKQKGKRVAKDIAEIRETVTKKHDALAKDIAEIKETVTKKHVVIAKGSHKTSEVLVSDERRHPVTEGTAIQIGHGNVNQGQSSVATEMPPSGPVPGKSEDDKQGPVIPVEILRMDDKSLQLYKKALRDGKEKVYNLRVMVVGQFGVGKTTLTKRLLGKQVGIYERQSTEGIDVYKHCCKISLDTGEWIVQHEDTEQDHQLQRIARVLIEKQSVRDRFPDEKEVVIPSQRKRTSEGDTSVDEEQEGRSDSNASVTYKEQAKMDPGNEILVPGSNSNVTADVQVIIPPQREINRDSNKNVTDKENGNVDPVREMGIPGTSANVTADVQVIIPPQREIHRDSNKNVTDKENGNVDPVREMGIPGTSANVAENLQVIIPPQGEITPDSNAYVADKEEVKDPMKEMLILLQENADQLKQDKGKVSPLSVWDFAGQYAFYTTHQTFLTRRAIYLLVSDISGQITDLVADECFFDSEGIRKCRVHELTDIWLNSIHSCAPSSEAGIPPVILVGTHVDKITQKQLPAKGIELETQIMTPATEQFTLPTTSLSAAASTKEQASASTIIQSVLKLFKPRKTKRNVEATPVSSMIDKPKEKRKWRFWKRTRKERFDADTEKRYRYELCERYFREVRSYLRDKPTRLHLVDEDFAIDNTILDRRLEDLKRKIVEVASQQSYWGEEIPARWLPLEQELMKLKAVGIMVIPLTLLEDLNKAGAVQIAADELNLFLQFHHDIGTILYFSLEVLKEHVVLDPQWMINALKSLITAEMFVLKSALAIADKWDEFKQKGKLYPELIDAVWSKKNNPDFHDNKEHILLLMEQLNIIAKPRYYSEDGSEVKVESYFLAPCMLSERTPTEVIHLAQHPERKSSSILCYVFQGKFLPAPIFHRLLAACVAHWPIAKKMSENLIFCGCCVFSIDLHHRLTMFFRDYVIFAQVTRMGATEKNLSFELCINVQKFITMNLSSIIGHLGQSLHFDLFIQCPRIDGYRVDSLIPVEDLKENEDVPCHFHDISHVIMSMDVLKFWFQETLLPKREQRVLSASEEYHEEEGQDDEPITQEHINHARLCNALTTVCADALREILVNQVPVPYANIYQVILAKEANLPRKLSDDQCDVVFPDTPGTTGTVDQFDISLLYTLIRNVSSVPVPSTGWGNPPLDQPRDTSLGASVERIRFSRNAVSGHSVDGKIGEAVFMDYWQKIDHVLCDIESVIGVRGYRVQLEKRKNQVITPHEAHRLQSQFQEYQKQVEDAKEKLRIAMEAVEKL